LWGEIKNDYGLLLQELGALKNYACPVVAQPSPRALAAHENSIFSHGLPDMGPLSESTKFTSNPSIPTEEQHATAALQIAPFSALSDLGELPYPKTNIWNRLTEKGDLGGYSNEAGVNKFVCLAIEDILEGLGIREKVTIRAEVEVMRNRPDFMLILVNGHPIGTIEGKQPGKNAMDHPNILGEVYDQLEHLRSIFRVDIPFAILTSYAEWRICWLNEQSSIERAGTDILPEPGPYETPVKKRKHETLGKTQDDMNLEHKKESPPLPATPSRTMVTKPLHLQKVDAVESDVETDVGTDDNTRVFCGTTVMPWHDRSLPVLLASLIKKMMLAKQDTKPAVLRYANATKSAWKKAPKFDDLNFDLCISAAVKCFYLWEDLGHGADGRAFLVSGGTKGAVGVLKFFYADPERKAKKEERMWKAVYSQLPTVTSTVRIVQVMGQTALLMPWFQCPERTQPTLDAVKTTLKEDFMDQGFRHGDVAWRNVGVYYDEDGQTKAVVFDMQQVENQTEEDWVTPAVASLSLKM
jgi:hypothetical protein